MSEVLSPVESLVADPVVKRSIVSTPEDLVREQFEPLRAAYVRSLYMSYAERRAHLDMLCDLVRSNHQTIAESISSDFGGRSTHETQIAEIFPPVATIKYIRSHLGTG
jgi:coniferyl-aldehyde dehydrogenase